MNEAFLQSICENPEDDAVRLIYADWLEENGDPRGEFIRAQVELAQLTADSPRRRELAFRGHQLLEQHGGEWAAPVRPFVEEWHFRRGFIDKMTVSAKTLVEHGEELFRLAPIERFRLTGANGDISFLAALPARASITSLDLIANDLPADVLTAIADNPALRNLKRLVLCFNPIGQRGAELLCADSICPVLNEIQCGGNGLDRQTRERLEARFGARLSFDYTREDDYLYPFQANGWSYWRAGLGEDFTQILLLSGRSDLETLLFDFEGNLIESQLSASDGAKWDDAFDYRAEQLKMKPAVVRVKRFDTADGEGLSDYEGYWFEDFDDFSLSTVEDRASRLQFLQAVWFREGQFKYTAGNGPWIDKTGENVAT
jgi:uncharacterized protein (TIGR02996 family)